MRSVFGCLLLFIFCFFNALLPALGHMSPQEVDVLMQQDLLKRGKRVDDGLLKACFLIILVFL